MNPLDAELLPVGELVTGMLDLDRSFDEADAVRIERLVCDLPIELAARPDTAGPAGLTVLVSPPRQPIITTVMPVFHRMRVTVVSSADD